MVNLIAAVGKQGQLGLEGSLPWGLHTEDLRWFKKLTMGHVLVVGYNTYRNLPPLPGRTVHCMRRGEKPEEVIEKYKDSEIWVAGGAKTYKQWMPYIERFYISVITYNGPADVFFPFDVLKDHFTKT